MRAGRQPLIDTVIARLMLPILGIVFTAPTALPLVSRSRLQYGVFSDAPLPTQVAGYGTSVVLIFVVTMVV